MASPHIVRTLLADGTTREYVYAFRGGPRVVGLRPGDPEFEAERQRLIAAFRKGDGATVARRRIAAEVLSFNEGAGISGSIAITAQKLVKNARHRAARKKLPCNLTISFIEDALRRQNMRCAVSGLPFDFAFNIEKSMSRNPYNPSLDRIDCKRGYVQGNVRVVLAAINYAINEWGSEEYLKICKAVAEANRLTGEM
jgi:hypothetical protein